MGILSKIRERRGEIKKVSVKEKIDSAKKEVVEKPPSDTDELVREIKEGFSDALVKFMKCKDASEVFVLYGSMLKGLWEYTKDIDRKKLKKVLNEAGFVELFLKVRDILEKKS